MTAVKRTLERTNILTLAALLFCILLTVAACADSTDNTAQGPGSTETPSTEKTAAPQQLHFPQPSPTQTPQAPLSQNATPSTIASPSPIATLAPGEGFPPPPIRDPKHPKLDSSLNSLLEKIESGELTPQQAVESVPLHRDRHIAVRVQLGDDNSAIIAFLASHGITPRHAFPGRIEAFVPIELLSDLSQLPDITQIDMLIPPIAPQVSIQPVPGNGSKAHGSSLWHESGITGAGIKIGVIDIGFSGASALLGTELPQTVNMRCYLTESDIPTSTLDCGESAHGTIVAESIIDIAPDAALYLAATRSTDDLVEVVDWMASEGVTIINMSLGWQYDGPGDGTSPHQYSPLNTLAKAASRDILWINSAGNSGQSSWLGVPTDLDANGIIEFEDAGEALSLNAHDDYIIQLRWQGHWGREPRDLNLHLRDSAGNIIAQSLNPQSRQPTHNPYELIATDKDKAATLHVTTFAESLPEWLQVVIWHGEITQTTESGSILSPADSTDRRMLAVGAAHWQSTDTIQSYSSRGPLPTGGTKPDIVGADCGQVTSGTFCGTSQASPHIAALAALVMQQYPDYAADDVAHFLRENAYLPTQDGSPNTWGAGFAYLPAPPTPTPTPTPTPPPNQDRELLTSFYRQTDGDNWKRNDNWLSNQPLDQWRGVALNADGRITNLSLPNNNLSGPIPPELTQLTTLRHIDLSRNNLTGTIPADIDRLHRLKQVSLDNNNLTGQIPAAIGSLTQLTSLYLASNQLSGTIPPQLGALPKILWIVLNANQLTGQIPPEIGKAKTLRGFRITDNQITGTIPATLGGMPELEILFLQNNSLSGPIPPQLGDLPKLRLFDLTDNQLSGQIPATLGRLPAVETINLANNELSGQIPAELADLPYASAIILSDNQLSGQIPGTLGRMEYLVLLALDGNSLTGPIPTGIADSTSLVNLHLQNNLLTGELPAALAAMPKLQRLYVDNNSLTGTLPQALLSMTSLKELTFHENQDLCSPTDDAFKQWLTERYHRGPECEDGSER